MLKNKYEQIWQEGSGVRVSNEDIVMDMAYENNGIVRMREVENIGISGKQ